MKLGLLLYWGISFADKYSRKPTQRRSISVMSPDWFYTSDSRAGECNNNSSNSSNSSSNSNSRCNFPSLKYHHQLTFHSQQQLLHSLKYECSLKFPCHPWLAQHPGQYLSLWCQHHSLIQTINLALSIMVHSHKTKLVSRFIRIQIMIQDFPHHQLLQ